MHGSAATQQVLFEWTCDGVYLCPRCAFAAWGVLPVGGPRPCPSTRRPVKPASVSGIPPLHSSQVPPVRRRRLLSSNPPPSPLLPRSRQPLLPTLLTPAQPLNSLHFPAPPRNLRPGPPLGIPNRPHILLLPSPPQSAFPPHSESPLGTPDRPHLLLLHSTPQFAYPPHFQSPRSPPFPPPPPHRPPPSVNSLQHRPRTPPQCLPAPYLPPRHPCSHAPHCRCFPRPADLQLAIHLPPEACPVF